MRGATPPRFYITTNDKFDPFLATQEYPYNYVLTLSETTPNLSSLQISPLPYGTPAAATDHVIKSKESLDATDLPFSVTVRAKRVYSFRASDTPGFRDTGSLIVSVSPSPTSDADKKKPYKSGFAVRLDLHNNQDMLVYTLVDDAKAPGHPISNLNYVEVSPRTFEFDDNPCPRDLNAECKLRERDVTIELEKQNPTDPTNNNVVARFYVDGYFVGRRDGNFDGDTHVFVYNARSVTKIVSSKIDTSGMKECIGGKTTVWCRGRRHTALL